MEKPPVNPVNKVELPKNEQSVEYFSLSKQEENIQEVFKLSPELKQIACGSLGIENDEDIVVELGRSKENTLGKIQNINVYYKGEKIINSDKQDSSKLYLVTKEDGTSYVGDIFIPTELQGQGLGKMILQKVADSLDTKITPTYLSTGGFTSENAKKMWEKIGNEILPNHEAEKLYGEYLKTIFPESKVQDIVWHGSFNHGFENFSKDSLGNATRAESAKTRFFFTDSFELARSYVTLTQEHGELNEKQNLLQQTYQLNQNKRGELDNVFKNTVLYKNAEQIASLYTGGDYMPILDKLMDVGFTARFTASQAIEIKPLNDETSQRLAKEALNISDADFVYPVILNIRNPKVFDDEGKSYREKTYKERLDESILEGKDSTIIYNTFDPALNNVYVVFESEQTHILGSTSDVEKFKEFVLKK